MGWRSKRRCWRKKGMNKFSTFFQINGKLKHNIMDKEIRTQLTLMSRYLKEMAAKCSIT